MLNAVGEISYKYSTGPSFKSSTITTLPKEALPEDVLIKEALLKEAMQEKDSPKEIDIMELLICEDKENAMNIAKGFNRFASAGTAIGIMSSLASIVPIVLQAPGMVVGSLLVSFLCLSGTLVAKNKSKQLIKLLKQ